MVTTITQMLLTSKINRPRVKCSVRKGIVIHYTGNTGNNADAIANRNYFERTTTYASTQFLVDDKRIIQAIPTWEAAWSVGATSYTPIGKKLFNGHQQPNYTTVSIEMCVNSNSVYDKVVENTVWLVVHLMKQLNLGINDIYRHYDITGKSCPLFYLKQKDWDNFLSKVKDAWNDTKRGENIVLDKIVMKSVTLIQNMNLRTGPNSTYSVVKSIPSGTAINVYEELNGWYRVDGGWINADKKYSKDSAVSITDDDYMSKVSPIVNLSSAKGKVVVNGTLNIRTNPNTQSAIIGSYKNDTVVKLLQENGGWYKTDRGWVFGKYITRIDERHIGYLINDANIRDKDLKVLATGKKGDTIIVFPGELNVNGIKIVPVKYDNIKGYVQKESLKLK